jgi:hypothetical protein
VVTTPLRPVKVSESSVLRTNSPISEAHSGGILRCSSRLFSAIEAFKAWLCVSVHPLLWLIPAQAWLTISSSEKLGLTVRCRVLCTWVGMILLLPQRSTKPTLMDQLIYASYNLHRIQIIWHRKTPSWWTLYAIIDPVFYRIRRDYHCRQSSRTYARREPACSLGGRSSTGS